MATRGLDRGAGERAGGRWAVRCAGTLSLTDEQGRDCLPRGRKSRALIALLVAEPGTRIPRETAMNLLWGDRGDQQARASLRQTLFEIRQAAGELVQSDRNLLWIDPARVDVTGHADAGEAFADLDSITPEFDAWLREERSRRSKSDWQMLRSECETLLESGDTKDAFACLDRLQRLDPYSEDCVRLAMQAEFKAGRPAGIDKRFRAFSTLLKTDLGISPATETRALRDRLLSELTTARIPEESPKVLPFPHPGPARTALPKRRFALLGGIAGALILACFVALRAFSGSDSLPVIAVAPADGSPQTQSLSRDLLVKLGTLPQIGDGRWALVDAGAGTSKPSLIFRASETVIGGKPHANLVLLGAPGDQVLWARDFDRADGSESDLRQNLALTAARVLGCALDAQKDPGLPGDLTRLFLDGCAASAEVSDEDRTMISSVMRKIVAARPGFAPAWGLLLKEDANSLSMAIAPGERRQARALLSADAAQAARTAPDLPELTLAHVVLLPRMAWAERLKILDEMKARFPDNADAWNEYSSSLMVVGRMGDAVYAAQRRVDLDPLSPAAFSNLIVTMAAAGQLDAAKEELERSERLWGGTGALRDAQYGFHLRYGDPKIARSMADQRSLDKGLGAFLEARLDPSPENIDRFVGYTKAKGNESDPHVLAFVVQAFGAFHRIDDVFQWLDRMPASASADVSYVLFRPTVAEVRRDPRFMRVVKRIGLVDYWQSSGKWPDFCSDPSLPYDCRTAAAALSRS